LKLAGFDLAINGVFEVIFELSFIMMFVRKN